MSKKPAVKLSAAERIRKLNALEGPLCALGEAPPTAAAVDAMLEATPPQRAIPLDQDDTPIAELFPAAGQAANNRARRLPKGAQRRLAAEIPATPLHPPIADATGHSPQTICVRFPKLWEFGNKDARCRNPAAHK